MKNFSFEEAYGRLESILETLNDPKIPLEKAVAFYEEADGLIKQAQDRLTTAEKKVETLIKNRNGSCELNEDLTPQTAPFQAPLS